jgi:hypothetical protein
VFLYLLKDFSNSQGNDSWLFLCAAHRVCLAAAGLAVGKHGSIEAANDLPNDLLCSILVYLETRNRGAHLVLFTAPQECVGSLLPVALMEVKCSDTIGAELHRNCSI